MGRHWWTGAIVFGGIGVAVGCSSNPYRPTFFNRNSEPAMTNGTEMSGPVMDGPAITNGNQYPAPPVTYPPTTVPPGVGAPPNQPAPTLPQGPMPKEKPGGTTTSGSPKT